MTQAAYAFAPEPDSKLDPPAGAPLFAQQEPLLVIHLKGSQEEMGRQHGRFIREAGHWQETIDYYKGMPASVLVGPGNHPRDRVLRRIISPLMERMLTRMERDRPPEYLARSRAFMEALGLDPSYARYLFVMDFLQNTVGFAGRYGLGPYVRKVGSALPPACSTLVAWGEGAEGGRVLHGRNFDFPGIGIWDRTPVVVFCEPDDGLRYGFVTTRGGDVPVTGFNEAGLVYSAHTRFHTDVAFAGAGIVDLGHDIIRKAETLAEARAIAESRPIASSWGLAIGSAREGAGLSLETTATGVAVVEAHEGDHFVACTNHYPNPEVRQHEVVPSPAYSANTHGRIQTLRRVARDAEERGGITVGELQRLLGALVDPEQPESRRASGGAVGQPCTVQTVVTDATERVLHVSVGGCPTWRGPFVHVPWSWTGEVACVAVEPDADGLVHPENADESEAQAAAHGHFVDAVKIGTTTKDYVAMLEAMERAVAADPDDPSYRLLAGGLRCRVGDFAHALQHFEASLRTEPSDFARGQLLLWAVRTARALGRRGVADGYRDRLLALDHLLLARYQDQVDAPYPARKLRGVTVLPLMPELQ
jgi:hypothetical protein